MTEPSEILTSLRRLLREQEHPGGVSADVIAAAEWELGVHLPRSYRIFLEHFGATWLSAPFEVYGLPPTRASDDEPPTWSHILDQAKMVRRYARIVSTLVPISDDGSEIRLYLDTARLDDNDECPVVAIGPGVDFVDVAPNFLRFVEVAVHGDPLATL